MREQQSNFHYLEGAFPVLHSLALGAEYNMYADPVSSLFKLRQLVEKLVDVVYSEHWLDFPRNNTLSNRIKDLEYKKILPDSVVTMLFHINKKGNIAAHQVKGTTEEVKVALLYAFKVCKWLYFVYENENDDTVSNLKFSPPDNLDARHALHQLEKNYAELESKFNALVSSRETSGLSNEKSEAIRERAERAEKKIKMNEKQTRSIIDEQLRAAGWEADTELLNFKKNKTLPQAKKNMAIAEWPCSGKWADYALFIGKKLYGVIEAKKYATDISTNLSQSKTYAELVTDKHEVTLLGQWRSYKTPFLFSTNGRKYLEQLKTKSGIWFLDVRKETNHCRSIKGWISPEGLKSMYIRDIEAAQDKLKDSDLDYLTDKTGLNLRTYQVNAIKAVERVLIDEPDRQRVLLAMATGTGKTRTINGLCYRLIKSNRFRRILFLVDRSMLAMQAADAFGDNKVEDNDTFGTTYHIAKIKDAIPDAESRLHFATVQSMVKRLFYQEDDEKILPVDTYDCIIVDEAHRGYLLDRQLDDEEIHFKNQHDYVSMYRMVIDYFDAFVVGLTATPALHTAQIFGEPIFRYTYPEAVLDGWLIDYDTPVRIKTKLSEEGIIWKKGERPKAYDREENEVIELDALADELHVELSGFNKTVITESFNRTVIKYLVTQLDPDENEKTLIFATRDSHADMIVDMLKQEFEAIGVDVADDAIEKITGAAYQPKELLKKFKNEKYPNIVVTVDLLTTGIDVPAICNLVFMRRVKSRILYEQMIGRATRRCDEIGKEVFRVYDAVRLYETLEEFTDMKPVVANPRATFTQLVDEMDDINTEERTIKQVEQIIAKLQRKKGLINDDEKDLFRYHADGQTVEEFITQLRQLTAKNAKETLPTLEALWRYLDSLKRTKRFELISEHADELREADAPYGDYKRPEDYITGFEKFIQENRNKIAALNVICTKPASLDRQSLKELKLTLEAAGFKTRVLNDAWKKWKNVDIAADIISYIRTLSLGSTLIDHETRIRSAMKTVRDMKSWNKTQSNWLDRFEKQLLAESLIQVEDLDRPPFKDKGGYAKLNRIFDNELDELLQLINNNLYKDIA